MMLPLKIPAALAACLLMLSEYAAAEILEWRSAVATSGTGNSSFVSIQNEKVGGVQKVYMAGTGSSDFHFGAINLLLPSRPSGIVVGGSREIASGALHPDWQSRAESSKSVIFTDMAIIPGTEWMAVSGRFEKDATFKDGLVAALGLPIIGIQLAPGIGTYGFFAILDRRTGAWKSAFVTQGILPASICGDSSATVVITGEGALAARIDISTGVVIWKTTALPAATRQTHIASRMGSPVLVLSEESADLAAEGVVLSALNPRDGKVLWSRRMGGPGPDVASGLAVDDFGRIHVAFQADYGRSTFASAAMTVPDPVAGDTVFVAVMSPDGTLDWTMPVSRPAAGTSLACPDIAVDSLGNTWLACSVAGNWAFAGSPVTNFAHDALALKVDAAGNPQNWFRANHPNAVGNVNAICAGDPGEVFVAGDYSGTVAPAFGTLPVLPGHLVKGAYVASLEIVSGQNLWVARPDADSLSPIPLPLLRSLLRLLGASIYAEIDADPGPKAISFWGTPAIVASLSADPRVILAPESNQAPSGTNPDPCTGLARLGGETSASAGYDFPDNTRPVRLYLIDTAVANPSNWIGANPKLTLEKSVLVRGSGDPVDSSQFKHGTQMLSLVGGMETGAAPGTPTRVVNYDIYPQGTTTTTTLLAKAVTDAVKDYRYSKNPLPSAICIATSSSTATTSYTLQSAIDSAISEGITVIVSAGNQGGDAADYIPSAYGSKPGVICIGATDNSDVILTTSNRGAAVDLLGPGRNLRTYGVNPDSRIELMSGTSPAAGLAAALVIGELSAAGRSTPAEVEKAIRSYSKVAAGIDLLRAPPVPQPALSSASAPADNTSGATVLSPTPPDGPITDPATPVALGADAAAFTSSSQTQSPDTDSDGIVDLLEIFNGSNPTTPEAVIPQLQILLSANQEVRFSFPVSRKLFDSSHPFTLTNGYCWRIRCSGQMASWTMPNGSLSASSDAEGRLWITATFPAEGPSCFARVEVIDPAVH